MELVGIQTNSRPRYRCTVIAQGGIVTFAKLFFTMVDLHDFIRERAPAVQLSSEARDIEALTHQFQAGPEKVPAKVWYTVAGSVFEITKV